MIDLDCKGVARIFGRGSAIRSEATDSAICFASEAARSAADQAMAVVRGRIPFWDFMTRRAPVNGIVSKSQTGCYNEQQAEFEVKLEKIITDTQT